jgi:UDP-N-acetylmuramoyl-tripeptide--D-alanyl-D-alanine ligase
MIPLSLADVAEITGGQLHDADPDTEVTGPAFLDTRTPAPGGLFAAFAGERADGHDHAGQAVAAGAVAVLGSRPTGVPTVVVADVEAALQELARTVLARRRAAEVPLTVLAVTGSQGKTSVKDLLAAVLAGVGPTVATSGSFNNELGLPLTVLRTEPGTRYLVLEMGARGIGHLRQLCAIAPPDVSLVLNVGKAHLGEFGSRENIAQAKGELVEVLTPEGAAVLNADDPMVAAMADRTAARVWTYGRAGDDVRLLDVVTDELGRPAVTLRHGGEEIAVQLQLLGAHQAGNAAAAVAAAVAAGCPFRDVTEALGAVERLSRWRMELHERADGLVVVNDAYNANPDSMRAALETLAGIGDRSGRPTVAVLGEMRELGEDAAAEHRVVGRLARELGIDQVYVAGEGARAIAEADPAARYFDTVPEAAAAVRNNVRGTEVVLVKASRAGGFERIAEELLRQPDNREPGDREPGKEATR